MLFDNYYKSLLDEGTDISLVMQGLYPDLPQKIPFWQAQFLSPAVKQEHNEQCRQIYAGCRDDYLKYSDLYCEYLELNDENPLDDEGKRYLENMMAASMAFHIIADAIIRNPIQWLRRQRRLRYFAGSGKRIEKMVAKQRETNAYGDIRP
ncbi:hypothetical protein LJC56_04020 [Christensenellaceae bacterium OttesenSCG-928-K19]|nr:hypothetical protein [Christensenellaceae bacterium OttesenSCG-928-K19]